MAKMTPKDLADAVDELLDDAIALIKRIRESGVELSEQMEGGVVSALDDLRDHLEAL